MGFPGMMGHCWWMPAQELEKARWIFTHRGVKKPIAATANKWSLDADLALAKLWL
jgi:hypothetical protein